MFTTFLVLGLTCHFPHTTFTCPKSVTSLFYFLFCPLFLQYKKIKTKPTKQTKNKQTKHLRPLRFGTCRAHHVHRTRDYSMGHMNEIEQVREEVLIGSKSILRLDGTL